MWTQLLFSKRIDLSKATSELKLNNIQEPLLPHGGTILNLDLLSQLSFFIKGERLWKRLRLLYAGSEAGFSNGSLETKVIKWNAPTILLISGQRISNTPTNSRERAFSDILPPRRYPPEEGSESGRVIYGAFLQSPWKVSHKGRPPV